MALPSGVFCTCFILMVLTVSGVQSQQLHELCKIKNRPLHKMEENESETFLINSTHNLMYPRFKNQCHLEYKVCPSCHLELVITNMTIPCSPAECLCGFLEVVEVLSQHSQKFCGNYSGSVLHFESKTSHIALDFVQAGNDFHVDLNITARRNLYIIAELPGSEQFVETPFFPLKYPHDYSAEYIFQSLDPKGQVRLLFLDFQILPESYIEVSGHNGYRVDTYNGDVYRPPAFTSQGIQLRLKFDANTLLQASKAGFRAKCRFLRSDWNFDSKIPYTGCGGTAQNYGGVIAVNAPNGMEQLVDCIWLLYPSLFSPRNIFSATIAEFQHIGKGSFLEYRKGTTSLSPIVMTIKCHASDCPAERQEITVSALEGVYIRFRGYLQQESSVVISYCTYSVRDCTYAEFECANGRCIHNFLHCDGYDHCTDNSDEKCQDEVISSTTSKRPRMVTAVPQVVREGIPAVIISLIVIAALAGLAIIILVGILLVNKFHKTRPPRRELRQMQLVLDVADESPALRVRQNEENPPSYEDVLKYSGRFPRLSYTSQTDAETNCSFTDFQHRSEETVCTSHENLASNNAVQNSRPTAPCKAQSSGSLDVAHLSFVSNCHSVFHSAGSANSKCIHETTRRLCRSLESKVNQCCCSQSSPDSCSNIHVIEREYVVLQTLPYRHVRCMTLPHSYKLPQREMSDSNHGNSENKQEADTCSSATGMESPLEECSCSLIEILPIARNRGCSDPCQVTVLDLHSFSRKKASTF